VPVALTPRLIENFSGVFLSPRFDNPSPTAPWHRKAWELYCSDVQLAAIAAPREHAKSTALTHVFILASVLFRFESHVMLIGSSEELAMNQLMDITKELKENDDLRDEFGVQKFLTDSKGEIIVRCDDGYEFRILARGCEQRVRGIKWNGRRPGLIVGDDMEEDEQVENVARRRKLSRWVNRALIPMGRKGCKVRFHGTLLHDDSLLARIVNSKKSEWKTLFYKAHKSFDDFSEILWPEMFNEERLRSIRQRFIDDSDAAGYAQEYLNDPHDSEDAFLKKEWFRPMKEEHHDAAKVFGVGVDFAISKETSANRTSLTVAGQDVQHQLSFVDQRVGRWDTEEIVDEFFSVHSRWRPDFFFVESGQIWLAIKPILITEMMRTGKFLNIIERTPIKDKKARGSAFQKRMKAGACFFDKEASWYVPYEEELLKFTGVTEAKLDDQFDSSALVALGFESMPDVEEEDVMSEEDYQAARQHREAAPTGRSSVTGY
jgi:predicted phage terminase large subunit-like protein